MNRSGATVLAILATLSFTGESCANFFNGGGKTITSAAQIAQTITAQSSNLVTGCATIPYTATDTSQGNATSPIVWHETYSDNTTTDAPILWPEGSGGSPYPITVYINPSMQSNTTQAAQAALSAWNTALVNNATGSVKIKYSITTDASSPNVDVEDSTTEYLAQDEGGTVGGSQVFTDITSDYKNLVASDVIINANLASMDTYVTAVHELGHALGLGHSIFQRSVMFPTVDTCLTGFGATNFDFADLNFLEANYDPPYAGGPSIVSSSSPNGCFNAPTAPQTSAGKVTTSFANQSGSYCGYPAYTQTLTLYENGSVIGSASVSHNAMGQRSPPNSPSAQSVSGTCSGKSGIFYATETQAISGVSGTNSYKSTEEYLACNP